MRIVDALRVWRLGRDGVKDFEQRGMKFFCIVCATNDGEYDYAKAMARYVLVTFCVSRRRRKMYYGHARSLQAVYSMTSP